MSKKGVNSFARVDLRDLSQAPLELRGRVREEIIRIYSSNNVQARPAEHQPCALAPGIDVEARFHVVDQARELQVVAGQVMIRPVLVSVRR